MNMKIVLIGILSVALPQMAWGMGPVVGARNVLMRIEELQKDLSQDQAELERLQGQQRQIWTELNNPRIVQLVGNVEELQRELQNAQQAEADAAAMVAIAEGDEKDRAVRAEQDAAYRASELTDRIAELTTQMQAMQLEKKQAQLEKIGASIEGVREGMRDFEAEIEDEQSTLESMDADAVAEARNILARKAGASIQAPVLTAPVLSEPVVTPQAQTAEQVRLAKQAAELRAAQKEAQERRERQQAAQAAQEAQERQAAQAEEERAFQEAQAAEQVPLAKQAAALRAAREARAQRAGEQVAPIAVAPVPVSVSVPAAPTFSAAAAPVPTPAAAAALAPAALLPAPAAPHFVQQHKKEIGAIIAAITVAIATYIGRRTYMNKKNRLIKKYGLDQLTSLQNAIWRATALASIRMPWYLQYLVRNNPKSVIELVGSDPRALAELYYGHTPSKQEVQTFLAKFFEGVK